MTQYLITEIQDSTGYVHRRVSKVNENEYMRVVEANSEDEALEKYKMQMQAEVIKKFGKLLKGLTDRLNKE